MRLLPPVCVLALAACTGEINGPDPLTIEELRNATYSEVLAQPVVLTDARFEGEVRPVTDAELD